MTTRRMVHCAVYILIGLVLPMAFHTVGLAGSIFLPMHLPVILAGLGLGPVAGATVGLIAPALSSILTGMPPLLPMLPLMVGELATYGLVAGLLYRRRHWGVYPTLVVTMLAGRLVAFGLLLLLGNLLQLQIPPGKFACGLLVYGLPGIGLQLFIIPILLNRLNRTHWKA